MPEYIEREKYVKLNDIIETLEHEWGYEGMKEDLYNLPTADVVEVKHGEWKYYNKDDTAVCKNCSYEHYLGTYHQYATNYCPNCGAKMDLKEGAEE